jgi:hypothetical protein
MGIILLKVLAPVMPFSQSLVSYDQDFNQWIEYTIELLKAQRFDELDIENLVDELESMSKRDKREIFSRLKIVLAHLLKWKYQPGKRSGSWRASIRNNREDLAQLINDSPSLKSYPAQIIVDAYASARLDAADETGLELQVFPLHCPFSIDETLAQDFWPEVD